MNKKSCEEFLEAVMTGERPLTGSAAAHVAACPACAALRREAEALARSYRPAAEPPAALDRRVLDAAHEELCRIRRRRSFLRRYVPAGAAAAAAAAVLCVVWLQPPAAPVGGPALADARDAITWDMLEEASFELDQELTSRQTAVSETAILW